MRPIACRNKTNYIIQKMKKEAKQLRKLAKIIFILGVTLLATIYIAEIIQYGNLLIEINVYEKLFASFMIYSAIVFHLLSKENQPIKKSIRYLKSSFNYIYIIIALFIVSATFGFIFAEKLSFLDEILREIISKTIYLNSYELTAFILMNNAIASLISIIGGIVVGIVPILSSIGNGAVIGYVLEKVGIASFWRLLPHGIFELPAVFISFGLGIKLGFSIFNKKKFRERFYNSILVFAFIIVPLLIIAAIIEGLLIHFLP